MPLLKDQVTLNSRGPAPLYFELLYGIGTLKVHFVLQVRPKAKQLVCVVLQPPFMLGG